MPAGLVVVDGYPACPADPGDVLVPGRRHDSGKQEPPHVVDAQFEVRALRQHLGDGLHTGEGADDEPRQPRRVVGVEAELVELTGHRALISGRRTLGVLDTLGR